MAKTTFAAGTEVDPAFLNALNNISFVEVPDNDGELPLITDAMMSAAAGNLKPEWQAFRDSLKPSIGTGLAVNYLGGVIVLPNNTNFTVPAGTVAVPNDSTSYVYATATGAIEASTSPPTIRLDIATVIATSGVISSLTDTRPRFRVQPRPDAIKVLGGTGGGGDVTFSTNTTLSDGIYYYRNLTVNAGVTLTIDGYAEIYCSGTVAINGIVNVSPLLLGGPEGGGTAISANGGGATGRGTGAGVGNQGGAAYNVGASSVGSSGGAGFFRTGANWNQTAFSAGAGGNGGGCFRVEAGGSITVAGSIIADGGNGGNATIAGGSSGDASVSGGGGGSGGTIILFSATSVIVSTGGTLAARGGNGGSTVVAGAISGIRGGAAGGGGQIVLIAPVVTTVGATVTVAAGSPGTPTTGTSTYAGSGGGGGNGGTGGSGHGLNIAAGSGRIITRTYIPVG